MNVLTSQPQQRNGSQLNSAEYFAFPGLDGGKKKTPFLAVLQTYLLFILPGLLAG